MEQVKQKDKFKVFSIIAADLFAVASFMFLLEYSLMNFITHIAMGQGFGILIQKALVILLIAAIFVLPLLVTAILLIFKGKSWLTFIPLGFSSAWYCTVLLFLLFLSLAFVMAFFVNFVFIELIEVPSGVVILALVLIIVAILFFTIAAIVILLGFLLRKKPQIPMFILAGVASVNFVVLALYNLYRVVANVALGSSLYIIEQVIDEYSLLQGLYLIYNYIISPFTSNLWFGLVVIGLFLAAIGMLSAKKKSKIALAAEIAMADELDGGMKIDGERNIEIDNAAIYEERSEETPVFQQVYAPQEDRFVAPEPEFKPLQQEYVAPASAPVTGEIKLGVADEILKFEDLYKRGVITREQFEAKKNQLLGM